MLTSQPSPFWVEAPRLTPCRRAWWCCCCICTGRKYWYMYLPVCTCVPPDHPTLHPRLSLRWLPAAPRARFPSSAAAVAAVLSPLLSSCFLPSTRRHPRLVLVTPSRLETASLSSVFSRPSSVALASSLALLLRCSSNLPHLLLSQLGFAFSYKNLIHRCHLPAVAELSFLPAHLVQLVSLAFCRHCRLNPFRHHHPPPFTIIIVNIVIIIITTTTLQRHDYMSVIPSVHTNSPDASQYSTVLFCQPVAHAARPPLT